MCLPADEHDLVEDFNRVVKYVDKCGFGGESKEGYLGKADEIATSIASLSGGSLSTSVAQELEAGSIGTIGDIIRRAYERCTPGSPAQQGYLDTADRLTGNIISIEGGLSDCAVSDLAGNLISAFDCVIGKAYGCAQGSEAQGKQLAAADDITGRITSLEGGLSARAVSGLQDGLLRTYGSLIMKAYIDCGYNAGDTQKKYLDGADEIVERMISIEGGLSERVVQGMKNSLQTACDWATGKALNSCVQDSAAQKRYFAVADEIKDKMSFLQPTLPGSGEPVVEEPLTLPDEVRQAMIVLNTPPAPMPRPS